MSMAEKRVGDDDRSVVAEQLRVALEQGRLELAEYDDRVSRAYTAKTYGDLDELLADMPGIPPASQTLAVADNSTTAVPDTDGTKDTESPPTTVSTNRKSKKQELKKTWTSFGGAAIFFTGFWAIGWIASGELPYYWPTWVLGIWGVIALCQTWSTLMRD